VTNPCTPRQVYCPALVPACGPEACALRAQLEAEPSIADQPTITLAILGTGSNRMHSSSLGIAAETVFGLPPPLNLQMCGTQANPQTDGNCSLVAQADALTGALPEAAVFANAQSCTAQPSGATQCTACTPTAVQSGTCAPSSQRFAYRAIDAFSTVSDALNINITIAELAAEAAFSLQLTANASVTALPEGFADALEVGVSNSMLSSGDCDASPPGHFVQASELVATSSHPGASWQHWTLSGKLSLGVASGSESSGSVALCLQMAVESLAGTTLGGATALLVDSASANATDASCAPDLAARQEQEWLLAALLDTMSLLLLAEAEVVRQLVLSARFRANWGVILYQYNVLQQQAGVRIWQWSRTGAWSTLHKCIAEQIIHRRSRYWCCAGDSFCSVAALAVAGDSVALRQAMRVQDPLANAGAASAGSTADAAASVLAAAKTCAAARNLFQASGSIGDAEAAFHALPDANQTIVTIRTQAFVTGSALLSLPTRALRQTSGFVPAVSTASVPSDWNVEDQSVRSDIANDLQPPTSVVGEENLLLGGLLVHQVR
jgi:hypothetical protein